MTTTDITHDRDLAGLGEPLELPDTVPPAFVRFAHAVFGPSIPRVETFSMRGPARMRPGRGPWLPLRAATYHRIGRGFAAEFDMVVGGRTVFSGQDSYIDGRAASWVGGRRQPSSPEAAGRRTRSAGSRPGCSRCRGCSPAWSSRRSTSSRCV